MTIIFIVNGNTKDEWRIMLENVQIANHYCPDIADNSESTFLVLFYNLPKSTESVFGINSK